MEISLVDVIMNFSEPLAAGQVRELEQAVRGVDGVISVHVSRDHPRTMLVEMNPARTTSSAILDRLQARGLRAELAVPERLAGPAAH